MFSFVKTAYAATNPVIDGIIVKVAENILNPLIELAFGVATVVLLWSIFKLIKNAENVNDHAKALKNIGISLIGFVVMLCAYGIIRFVLNTIGVQPPPGL